MLGQTLDFPHFLFIDTATDLPILAYRKFEKWDCVLLQRGPELSRMLLTQLSRWNLTEEVKGSDSLQIILGTGPGSYAGIRTGVTIAQALGFAWEVSVHRINSLEWLLPEKEGVFTACIDAKAGGIYAQKRIFSEGKNYSLGAVMHYLNAEALICEVEEGAVLVASVPLVGREGWDRVVQDKKISFYTAFDPLRGVFMLFSSPRLCTN